MKPSVLITGAYGGMGSATAKLLETSALSEHGVKDVHKKLVAVAAERKVLAKPALKVALV